MKNKDLIDEKQQQLLELTQSFCHAYLDQEYADLCERLIAKMARKRTVPFLSGRLEIWAAAIIHALGSINFLFDKASTPYTTAVHINEFFNTSKNTTGQKSKLIRDMFKLGYFDPEFSTKRIAKESPFAKLVSIDGLIVPSDMFKE